MTPGEGNTGRKCDVRSCACVAQFGSLRICLISAGRENTALEVISVTLCRNHTLHLTKSTISWSLVKRVSYRFIHSIYSVSKTLTGG